MKEDNPMKKLVALLIAAVMLFSCTAALAEGRIGESRYSSYVKLYELTAQHKPWEIKQNNQT